MMKLLVVDIDPLVHARIENCFSLDCAEIQCASNLPEAKEILASNPPEICLLDLGPSGADSQAFCKEISEQHNVGVIVVSAIDARQEQIKMLDLGADDYVVKPFDDLELRARVGALARRIKKNPPVSNRKEFSGNVFDFDERRLKRLDGSTVFLTISESQILRFMLNNPGVVLPREDLLSVARMRQHSGARDRSVDNLVSRLRQKVEMDATDPRHVMTVWGRGYQFNI